VVFFAIGFETTTPPTAVLVRQAQALGLKNLSVFCNHVLTPAAMRQLLAPPVGGTAAPLDGIIGPSHVSTVIGLAPYAFVTKQFGTPLVVAGFEPLDVLQAVYMLVQQINAGEARVENQYQRVVRPEGNRKAQALMASVFALRERFAWRGLGEVPHSALALRAELATFDAERRFAMPPGQGREHKSCECPAILRGEKSPAQCRLFGVACTPERPLGPCMVSPEGACAAHWSYGRAQDTRTSKKPIGRQASPERPA
jgi:hydrogenase expression/formation protein HypD